MSFRALSKNMNIYFVNDNDRRLSMGLNGFPDLTLFGTLM